MPKHKEKVAQPSKDKLAAHSIEKVALVKQLLSNTETGLSQDSVKVAIEKFGKNVLKEPKKKSMLSTIIKAIFEPMMIILLLAFSITLAVNIVRVVQGKGFEVAESIGIFIAIALSVTISVVMERKSDKAFLALKKIGTNEKIKVLRSGNVQSILHSDIVVGDIIFLEVGDKIPCDCRLLQASEFSTDESMLTGESKQVKKNAELIFRQDTPLAERKNMVYGGSFVTSGTARAMAVFVGDSTQLGLIAQDIKNVKPSQTPLQKKLSRLGRLVALLGGIAAGIAFIVQIVSLAVAGNANFESVQSVFISSIILIVAAVPEGLPTIVAISLALNVIKMAKYNALVKKPSACETIGSVSVICSDKTGTLTENKMTVEGYFSKGKKHSRPFSSVLVQNICVNSTAELEVIKEKIQFIGSPTECALLESYGHKVYKEIRKAGNIIKAYPFSSDEKRSTVVLTEGDHHVVLTKGAPEVVLSLCQMPECEKQKILQQIEQHQKNAKRVIAFASKINTTRQANASREVLENALSFDGFAIISDPIRKDVKEAVKQAKKAGVEVKMLTGDHRITAQAIAQELGICNAGEGIFNGSDIEKMSDSVLEKTLPSIKVVARSTPSVKLRIVLALKKLKEVVAVTGDGVNDAPAIKSADVGIAMGIAGTTVTKEAADIVLLDDSFSGVVTSIKWGRGIYENFQRFMVFQLTVNIAAVLLTVFSIILGFGAPFTTLQLLWINLIMDGPPALSLGLEKIDNSVMARMPVKREASIITKRMAARIGAIGVFMAGFLLLQAATNFMGINSLRASSFMFSLFIVMQLFNALNSRELSNKSLFKSVHKNKILLITVAIAFVFQIIITQFGGFLFGTVPLSFLDWVKIVAVALGLILACELYKLAIFAFDKKRNKKNRKKIKLT